MAAPSALFERLVLNTPYLTQKITTPAFLYGTAWKKEATAELTLRALSCGFTGVDTACQPKHYREDLVGAGLRQTLRENGVARDSLFVQTKFTPIPGQDPRNMPYEKTQPLTRQVQQSIEVSLTHLSTADDSADGTAPSYIDCVVLHSPLPTLEETLQVWKTLESYVPSRVRALGLSNTSISVLEAVYEQAEIKPAVVQNRFYAGTRFDADIRRFCRDRDLIYQCFWTLSANPALLQAAVVRDLATRLDVAAASALYCLVLGLGNIIILNGTKSEQHMRADLEAVALAKNFATAHAEEWQLMMTIFRQLLQDD